MKTFLFPEQQALLSTVDKVEDSQLQEMEPTALLEMIHDYDREAEENK